MPTRSPLPTDDLYARLGVPPDASPEAIELAWRGLLRKHHPDVAGPAALELAKQINVAHDWLSDADLRGRYDRERPTDGTAPATGRWRPRDGAGSPSGTIRRTRRPLSPAERVAAVVARVGRLTIDDLDRLGRAEPAPVAFLATLRRFVPPDLRATLDEAEERALASLAPAARREVAIRDAITGQLADIVLGDLIDELLGDPAGMRARERLTRGWDAAVGQPRYGPATMAVTELVRRLGRLQPEDVRALAGTGARDVLGDAPWPTATSPDEDEALRVSSELAAIDAATAVDSVEGVGERHRPAARRAAGRVAHLLVLRHAFPGRTFERHAAPWIGWLIPRTATGSAHVRSRTAGG